MYDEYIHASVHEGMRLSRAGSCVPFAHNSLGEFERVLREKVEGDELIRVGKRNVFVAVESVYSMDGDVAPIRGIVEVVERMLPRGNGHVVVDEAHSTGITGPGGRGVVCGLGLEGRVFARLHTFGKAMSSSGGVSRPLHHHTSLYHCQRRKITNDFIVAIILCAPVTREFLINYARPLIYTTFMSFPALVAIRVAYNFMIEGNTEPVRCPPSNLQPHSYPNPCRSIPAYTLVVQAHRPPPRPNNAPAPPPPNPSPTNPASHHHLSDTTPHTPTSSASIPHLLSHHSPPTQPGEILPRRRVHGPARRAAYGSGREPAGASVFACGEYCGGYRQVGSEDWGMVGYGGNSGK